MFVLILWAENSFGREPRISTTVYVGQHFELREHDAPIKYVFNGGTRVARVSGTLTATNTRVQRLRVVAGWNLCSMAVTAPNALAQLSSINGQSVVSAAYRWNSVTGGWDSIATADTVVAGTVVWLKSTLATTLRLKGVYPGPAANLRAPPEGAFFPSYGLEIWDFSGRNSDPSVTLQRFDAVAGEWMSQLPAPPAVVTNFPKVIGPGEAFFARALVPIDLEIPDAALSLRYYHQDHLGSSSSLTDAQGNLIEETANYPFGYPRHQHQPKSLHEPYQFTQKEQDAESGLHYFDARYLAANLARFAGYDRLAGNPGSRKIMSPQRHHPYSYVCGNPLRFTDPTGNEDKEQPTEQTTSSSIDRGMLAHGLLYTGLGVVMVVGAAATMPVLAADATASAVAWYCFNTAVIGGTVVAGTGTAVAGGVEAMAAVAPNLKNDRREIKQGLHEFNKQFVEPFEVSHWAEVIVQSGAEKAGAPKWVADIYGQYAGFAASVLMMRYEGGEAVEELAKGHATIPQAAMHIGGAVAETVKHTEALAQPVPTKTETETHPE